ncbi:DUF262 domain-containing HNH endonuclease family protein [Fulvimarina sp. MAC3]|uniref:DUF262 domain-containing protein n=1 Tax=Fulvimarina sp. MAC3 TaxID=3148887 RepID=UPI0031FD5E0E
MQLSPTHLTVNELLGGRLFRIPDYQRAYAWGPRQRDDLFRDIVAAKESGREHFMATVVALALDKRLIGADAFKTVEIVDGQQRLTTLIILIKAIEKALSKDQAQEKVRLDLRNLLVKNDDHSLVLLQTNHDASDVFVDYIRDGKIREDNATTAADLRIVDAARECEDFVQLWLHERTAIDLIATIRHQLSMIYHELADETTVYRVFEVLNSRGLDVKWIDKLKSQLMALLFEHLTDDARAEAVHEMRVVWQDIYRILGLEDKLGDEALRFAGTLALVDRPNRILSEQDAAAEITRVAGAAQKTIVGAAKSLREVVRAVNTLDRSVRLRAVTRIRHARFVATAILLGGFEKSTQDRLLGRWERVTFRIFGLGGADTRHKVGDYVRLGYDIGTGSLSAKEVEDRLRELGDGWSINEVILGPDYWSDCYNQWTEELRYILFRYDEHLADEAGTPFDTTQWNKIWAEEASRSIEHIQPQSSQVSYVHHLGNLTMLPPRVNSRLQDKSPLEKSSTYRGCGLAATRAVGEEIRTATDKDMEWDEVAVQTRTKRIEEFVRKEWAD